jgi:hypothetical protein
VQPSAVFIDQLTIAVRDLEASRRFYEGAPAGSEDLVLVQGEPAAPAAGGRDNGGPGERPHYHPGYYAADALDADSSF